MGGGIYYSAIRIHLLGFVFEMVNDHSAFLSRLIC